MMSTRPREGTIPFRCRSSCEGTVTMGHVGVGQIYLWNCGKPLFSLSVIRAGGGPGTGDGHSALPRRQARCCSPLRRLSSRRAGCRHRQILRDHGMATGDGVTTATDGTTTVAGTGNRWNSGHRWGHPRQLAPRPSLGRRPEMAPQAPSPPLLWRIGLLSRPRPAAGLSAV